MAGLYGTGEYNWMSPERVYEGIEIAGLLYEGLKRLSGHMKAKERRLGVQDTAFS